MSRNPFYTKMVRLTRWFVTFLHPLRVVGRENVPAEPVTILKVTRGVSAAK